MIRDTQYNSYEDLKETVERKRMIVYEAIKKILGWPVNRISGRVTELSRMDLIVDSSHRLRNPDSGKLGIIWVIKPSKRIEE